MNFKRLFSAFFLAVILALAVPAIFPLSYITGSMSAVYAADGWNEDSTGVYYLQDDTRLTGMQVIDGCTYYFDAGGYRMTGSVTVGDSTYVFHPNTGKLCTGISGLTKLLASDTFYYYFNGSQNGIVATSQWVVNNGRYYYADSSGHINFGTIKVGSKLYHVTEKTGRLTAYGKSSYDGNYYYAKVNGVLRTGLQTINGNKYYFNKKTGQRQTGAVTVGKYTYYFAKKTGIAKTGWVKLKDSTGTKKYYYYNKKGRLLTGLKTISGKKYYLNPDDNGARATSGWYKIGSYYYYFNKNGVMKYGFVTTNGKTYYTNSSGVRQTGWKTIDGSVYFFNKKTGVMKTGWKTRSGKKYYLNPSKTSSTYGAAVTGWMQISSYWYYFNSDGTMHTGWLTDNLKKYYFDTKTGRMLTGTQTINGTTYDFGTSGAITVSGTYRVEVNRKSCFVVIYRGNTAVKAFVCSTAKDGVSTPTGTFKLLDKLRWHTLIGPSYGQYCSHITSDILFHSVTYSAYGNVHSLSASAYNMLGSPASAGCIRLTVASAKWMYDNLPIGTTVYISDNVARPTTVEIETAQKIPLTQNYDPTDPAA